MSQPVDFDLNLGGNYVASMGQAVAVSSQYADVAEGIRGKVGNLSNAMVGLTNRMTGFNRINSVATDSAAGYQKILANIESTAAVTGKSFDALSFSTRKLARDFPIGIAGAVDVVESLQSVGVKSEKTIASLGKSFVNLGAATNTNAASIGRDMTLLGKSFGNGVSQFEALSDSLTTVTKQLGASAPATIAFSKAIAPIASTVGMGQTAVMGLSAAMSSLGEDGYRAANTFNKVLLDMNKAVRDGGPELKAYADVMGTTSDKLADLFKTNPSEMLARFTETLGKAGPEAQRALESLGFDSVRDTRSLQALSRSGGLREAISTSVGAYGSGSTQKAAEVAMGGVTDQAEKLKETMSQTVQNLGAPLLGIMKNQLSIATNVAGVMEKITGSGPAQAAGGPIGVAGTIGGIGMNALSVLMYGALAKTGIGALMKSPMMTGLRAGMAAGSAGFAGAPAQAGSFGQSAAQAGFLASSAMRNRDLSLANTTSAMGRLGGAGIAMTSGMGTKFMNAWYGNIFRSANGVPAAMTEDGQRAKYAINEASRTAAGARTVPGGGEGPMMSRTMAADRAWRANQDMLAKMREEGAVRNMGSLGRAGAGVAAQGGLFAAGTVMRGAAGVGKIASALPFSPAMVGAAAVIGTGIYAYGQKQDADTRREQISAASQDVYAPFNRFAEAAGQAGRGLVSFDSAIKQTTENLSKSNTTMAQATNLTGAEIGQARQAGYQTAFKPIGDSTDPKRLASQITAVLGSSPAPQDVSRALMDVTATFGEDVGKAVAKEVNTAISPVKSNGSGIDFKAMVADIIGNSGPVASFFGPSEAQAQLAGQDVAALNQRSVEATSGFAGTKDVKGVTLTAAQVVDMDHARALYEAAQQQFGSMDSTKINKGDYQAVGQMLSKLAGLTDEQSIEAGVGGDFNTTAEGRPFIPGAKKAMSFDEWVAQGASQGAGNLKAWQAAQQAGYSSKDLSAFAGEDSAQSAARAFAQSLDTATGSGKAVTTALYELGKIASNAGTSIAGLPESVKSSLTPTQKSLQEVIAAPENDQKSIAAGQKLWAAALEDANGNTTKALSALQDKQASLPENSVGLRNAMGSAMQQGNVAQQLDYAGRTRNSVLAEQVQVGRQAETAPVNQSTAISNQQTIQSGQQAQAGFKSQALGFVQQYQQMQLSIQGMQRSAGVSMGSIARDGALKVKWATEDFHKGQKRAEIDYNISVAQVNQDFNRSKLRATKEYHRSVEYAEADYQLQRKNTIRDFNISINRAERDYQIARGRMIRDYDTGTERANRDFNKQQARAEEDYQKQRARAVDDYNTQIARAQRDFGIQQLQATEDYNKARTRALEDYNKQVKRLVEDSAKSMYDPYKRIAAQMVMDAGQLVTNLKDQTNALNKQVGNLAQARAMGMTDATIKALSLADSGNAQQLQRLLEDSKGNPDFIRQLNEQVAAKQAAAEPLATDQGSTQFSRMSEDFATSQLRAAEDFKTSQDRSSEAFARSMEDAQVDFTKSMSRMADDYAISVARAKDDFSVSMEDRAKDFKKQLVDMAEDHLKGITDATNDLDKGLSDMAIAHELSLARMKTAFEQSLTYMEQDHERTLNRMAQQYEKTVKRSLKDFEVSIDRMKIQTANAISDVGAAVGAQIQNMKEQLAGLLQQFDPKNQLELAKGVMDTFGKLGFDRSELSADNQKLWDWAQGVIDAVKAAKDAKTGYNSTQIGQDVTSPGYVPSAPKIPTGGNSQIPSPPPKPFNWVDDFLTKDIRYIDWSKVGDALWPDNWDFMAPDIAWDEVFDNVWPDNWDFLWPDIDFAGIWDGFMSRLKSGFAKITDFDAIAKSMGEMLGKSIKGIFAGGTFIKDAVGDALANAWDFLTVDIPNIKDAVMLKITAAVDWITTDLPAIVTSAAASAWGWLTSTIPDVVGAVTDAFDKAKDWLAGLPGMVVDWVGDAWSGLLSGPSGNGSGGSWGGPDIGAAISKAFENAGVWLQGLGGRVLGWIGSAWDGLTSELPGLNDIKDKVVGVFLSAKEWLGGLGGTGEGSIIGWVAEAWDGLWKNLPTVDELKQKVVDIFIGEGGLKSWLGNLDEWILANVPGASAIANAFSSLTEGVKSVIRGLMQMWNALEFKIDFDFGPINNIGKFDGWSAKTLTDMFGNEHTLIPAFPGWDGFSIGKVGIHTGDLIPNVPIPDILQASGKAGGGPTISHKAYIVGETGPELFISGQSGVVVPHGITNRLVASAEARQSMVAPYSSPVYNTFNHTEDYSTHVSGVTVQANDPDDFMRQMEAKAARSRLSNRVGSR